MSGQGQSSQDGTQVELESQIILRLPAVRKQYYLWCNKYNKSISGMFFVKIVKLTVELRLLQKYFEIR